MVKTINSDPRTEVKQKTNQQINEQTDATINANIKK
jgi:hypothetical protein